MVAKVGPAACALFASPKQASAMPARPTPNFFSAARRVTDWARLLVSSSNFLFMFILSFWFCFSARIIRVTLVGPQWPPRFQFGVSYPHPPTLHTRLTVDPTKKDAGHVVTIHLRERAEKVAADRGQTEVIPKVVSA